MNTKDLKSFLEICKYHSISSASKSLYMTPQGLSKLIKKLENELSVQLFYRNSKGFRLTEYGELLKKKSTIIIEELENIPTSIKSLQKNINTTITLASTLGTLAYLSVDFIDSFQDKYPEIKLNIMEGSDVTVENAVCSEVADIGFLAGTIDILRFNACLFTHHNHCLVINKNNPLSKKSKISYKDLDGELIALEGREFHPYYNNLNRFLKANVHPQILFETHEINFVHLLASQNKAIGISVDFAANADKYDNTVILPFEDENCTWETYIVTKKEKATKKPVMDFINFSLEWIKNMQS